VRRITQQSAEAFSSEVENDGTFSLHLEERGEEGRVTVRAGIGMTFACQQKK
jgi:hypothetical protein